jgi:Protein of unknown function (DUF2931)
MTPYNWLPTECAPRRFPVRLIKGTLQLLDGSTAAIPDRRDVFNGWGRTGSTHVVGPARKPIPVRLDLRWFSYTEDCFFEGSIELPQALLARLFASGIAEGRHLARPEEFNRVIVGMAPHGQMAVWLAAAGGEVVEVAAGRAQPLDLPWSAVTPNATLGRAAYIERILREFLTPEQIDALRRDGAPRELFPSYHARYRWVPRVKGTGSPQYLDIVSLNGENARIGPKGAAVPCDNRPVPSVIEVAWKTPAGEGLRAVITLDEAESLAAFSKLAQGDRNKNLTLTIETQRSGAAITLQDGQFVLPFKATQTKVWAAP